jgi:hypothetical protein
MTKERGMCIFYTLLVTPSEALEEPALSLTKLGGEGMNSTFFFPRQ